VSGLENVPKSGPVIFAVNHQNYFLDALIVTVTTSRNPYFLARGDVFRIPMISYLLNYINIMPIYRSRDGVKNIRKNEAIIDKCVDLLDSGHPVLIFPEANHEYKYQLRPIQKGVSRIAFAANKPNRPIRIVPVGIQFESYRNTGYPVLVSYGKPILVSEFQEKYIENHNAGFATLSKSLGASMRKLIIDIQEDQYEVIYKKWKSNRSLKTDRIKQLQADQKLVKEISINPENFSSTKIQDSNFTRWTFLPFYLISCIAYFIPWAITNLILSRIKDDQYIASLKVSIWFLIVPEVILLEGLLLSVIFNSMIAIGFIILSFLSGWITIKRYFPL